MALLTLSCWACTAAPRSCSFWFAFATAATRDPMVSGPPGSAVAITPDWENTVAEEHADRQRNRADSTAQPGRERREGCVSFDSMSPKARERKAHSFGTQSQKSH